MSEIKPIVPEAMILEVIQRQIGEPIMEASFAKERYIAAHFASPLVPTPKIIQTERYLVHSNCGFSNVLVANDQVTAVLDWLNARYGDFLYDVAWLNFWDSGRAYPNWFRVQYTERDLDIPKYESRLLCYQCCIALDGLRFFAAANNAAAYQWVKDHILRLIPSD